MLYLQRASQNSRQTIVHLFLLRSRVVVTVRQLGKGGRQSAATIVFLAFCAMCVCVQ